MNFNEFKEFKDCLLTPRSFIITSIELQVTETKTDGSRLQTHATVFVSALTAAASHFHGSVPLTGRPHCSCSRLCAGVPGHTEQLWTAERARPSSAAEEEEEYDCSAPEGCILTIDLHAHSATLCLGTRRFIHTLQDYTVWSCLHWNRSELEVSRKSSSRSVFWSFCVFYVALFWR